MDIKAYLERIKIDDVRKPDLEFLAHLQNQHLLCVPFENLDIHREGHEIILDYERLYDKIVTRNRGGFCYELNGLFCWLLRELGYRVDMLQAEVFSEKKDEWGPPFDHMTLLVHLEESYLVDVGFGDSARSPIRMPDGETEYVGGKFRLVTEERQPHMQREQDGEWRSQHRFSIEPREFHEFKEMCNFHQNSPESHFTQGRVCTLAKEWGRVTLTDRILILTKGSTKTNINFAEEDEFSRHLEEQFGIVLDD